MANNSSTGYEPRPYQYDGDKKEWESYAAIAKSTLGRSYTKLIGKRTADLDDAGKELNIQWFAWLLGSTKDTARSTVQSVTEWDGIGAWEALVAAYEPSKDSKEVDLITRFVDPESVLADQHGDVFLFLKAMDALVKKLKDVKIENIGIAMMERILPVEFNAAKTMRLVAEGMPYQTALDNYLKVALEQRKTPIRKEDTAMMAKEEVKKWRCRDGTIKPIWVQGKGQLCFNCERYGHNKYSCRQQKEAHMVISDSIMAISDNNSKEWYVDSCASISVTPYKQDFVQRTYRPFGEREKRRIRVANGKTIDISGIGMVELMVKVKNSNQFEKLCFAAYYVPQLMKRLFSGKHASQHAVQTTLSVIHPSGKELELVEVNGLPTLHQLAEACMISAENQTKLSHMRTCHLGKLGDEICEACIKGKLHRAPHSHGIRERSQRVNENVYTDIVGKINPASRSGFQYAQVFVDSHSRFYTVKLLRRKSDSYRAIVEFIKDESSRGHKVGTLHCDNGRELISEAVRTFLSDNGVQLRTSAPYTSEDNGLAERCIGVITTMARCALSQSTLSKALWPYAFIHAAHVHNRHPMKVLGGMTPLELKTGKKEDMSKLPIFGCPSWIWKPVRVGKLDDLAQHGIFVGISELNGCYQFLVNNGHRQFIIESRTAKFDEKAMLDTKSDDNHPLMIQSEQPIVVCSHNGDDNSIRVDEHDVVSNPAVVANPDVVEARDVVEAPDLLAEEQSQPFMAQQEEKKVEIANESREAFKPRRNPRRAAAESNRSVSSSATIDAMAAANARASMAITHDDLLCMVHEGALERVPKDFREAQRSTNNAKWMKAVQDEIEALLSNGTWEVIPRPIGANVIDSKWVFVVKYDADGVPERWKARLTARGFKQKNHLAMSDIFAPVARYTTVRTIVAIAASKGWKLEQSDVSNAFLNGELKNDVYMEIPDGMAKQKGMVIHLLRALYGLRESPNIWNSTLHQFLLKLGFVRSCVDDCLYSCRRDGHELHMALYVDDMIYTSDSSELMEWFKQSLQDQFKMKHMGLATHILGMKVDQMNDGIKLSQSAQVEKILKSMNLQDCNPCRYPIEVDESQDNGKLLCDPSEYQSLVGSFMFLQNCTRPDISFAVNYLARFMSKPTDVLFHKAKQLLRYLKGTINDGIMFERKPIAIVGYCDATWAARSVSGYIFFANGPLSWASKVQHTPSLSSTESELQAATLAAQEAMYLLNLVSSIGITASPITLNMDNESTQMLIEVPRYSSKLRHITIRELFITKAVEDGRVQLNHVGSKQNVADTLTKSLKGEHYVELKKTMVR